MLVLSIVLTADFTKLRVHKYSLDIFFSFVVSVHGEDQFSGSVEEQNRSG